MTVKAIEVRVGKHKHTTKLIGGDCYRAAYRAMDQMYMDMALGKKAFLVHGRPTLRRPPYTKFGHAWVELEIEGQEDPLVRDLSNGQDVAIPRSFYYALGQIEPEDVIRISIQEMWQQACDTGHFGPWDNLT